MTCKKFAASALMLVTLSSAAQSTANTPANRSPYFARVDDTVFVSGHFLYWSAEIQKTFYPPNLEDRQKLLTSPVKNFVFVNVVTNRPDKPAGYYYKALFERFGISNTYVMGDCDLFCARAFVGAKHRQLAQDVGETRSRVAFQIPYNIDENWQSSTLERKFPATQLAPFEAAVPDFAKSNKDLLIKAFTKPLDGSGGLFIGQDEVTYCDSISTGTCETLKGMNAFSMGLTTNPERALINLPPNFGAPRPSGFAKIDDVNALPVKDNSLRDVYRTFLGKPKLTGRFFAVSESGDSVGWSWGSDNAQGNAVTRALNSCEKNSATQCRLYAVGDDVVWNLK
jgi:hypothetical protein